MCITGWEEPAPIFQQQDWTEAIIKPLAGASSHLVERVQATELADWSQRIRSQRNEGAWLIQEFRAENPASWRMVIGFSGGGIFTGSGQTTRSRRVQAQQPI